MWTFMHKKEAAIMNKPASLCVCVQLNKFPTMVGDISAAKLRGLRTNAAIYLYSYLFVLLV